MTTTAPNTSDIVVSTAKRRRTAVEAKRGTIFMMDPLDLTVIGIDTRDTDAHPLYDVDPIRHLQTDDHMVKSIEVYGVRQTVDAVKREGKVAVVSGRRRVLHARVANANLKKAGEAPVLVPVRIVDADDSQLLGLLSTENEIRMETTLLGKARLASKMRVAGMETADIAIAFGVAPNTIRTWFTLLEADPKIHKAIEKGVISESAGAQFATLPPEKQVPALEKAIDEAKATGAKKVTHSKARATSNEAAGRAENVGLRSRKQMKRLRDECSGDGDENKEGKTYLAGVRDALSLVLGDLRPECAHGVDLRKIVRKIQKADKSEE